MDVQDGDADNVEDAVDDAVDDVDLRDDADLLDEAVAAVGKGAAKYSRYPPEMNIAIEENMIALENEVQYTGSRFLTAAGNNLMLVSGQVTNVSFHEKDLVAAVTPDTDILHCSSNFGKATYELYDFPTPEPPSNRGRKAREPKKVRARQKVGNGNDMNTQVCFWVRRPNEPIVDGRVPKHTRTFKIKLFRTGDIQLTGSRRSTVREGRECCQKIVDMLNRIYHNGEPVAQLSPFVPVLKNYQLRIVLPTASHIVHLANLHRLFAIKQHYDCTGTVICRDDIHLEEDPANAPEHPRILCAQYSPQESRVAITFKTPLPWRADKRLVMRVFVRGSILIVGGLFANDTTQICNFLHWLIRTNYARIIVRENEAYYEDNISDMLAEKCIAERIKARAPKTREDIERSLSNAPQHTIDSAVALWDWQKKFYEY